MDQFDDPTSMAYSDFTPHDPDAVAESGHEYTRSVTRRLLISMFDALDTAIMSVDADRRILLLNRPFATMLGEWGLTAPVPPERPWIGRSVAELLGGAPVLAPILAAIDDVLAGRLPRFQAELAHGGADAGRQWVFRVHPAPGGGGTPELVMISGLDITDQRRAEAQVRLAQKHEAVGRLAAGIAHDFNNIIQGTIGHLELIKGMLAPDSAARESIAQIDRAAMREAELVRNLVSFSQTMSTATVPLDLNDAIVQTRGMLTRVLIPDIHLQTVLDPHVPRILGSLQLVQQVLLNLVLNARDAMPLGGELTVRTALAPQAPPPAPAWALLEVRDSGNGIDPDLHDKVFDPYFTTKHFTQGTGLGLAVVYRIVEQLSGRIELDSALGRGTAFRILFPPAGGQAQPDEAPDSRRLSRRALVVDDDVMLLELHTRVLRQIGFEVTGSIDGAQAWEEVKRQPPDWFGLMMIDLTLPRIQGLDLHRLIEERSPGQRYILSTGFAMPDATREAIEQLPRVRLLQKPTRPGDLIQAIADLYGPLPIESRE